ncbi:MAG: FHA domain-containing protein [Planctomycetes bacterium]|nr:FHA domain-containing protein [Planctomycetota bacterium]
MLGQLIPLGGGSPIPLRRPRIVVGRAPECDVVLSEPTVSGKHCLLELRDDIWYAFDLASRNGIRINGIRCQEGRIEPGSELGVAGCGFRLQPLVVAEEPTYRDAEDTRIGQRDAGTSAFRARLAAASCDNVPQNAPLLGELVPCQGGPAIPLRKRDLVIGRSPECDLILPMPVVSSKHCRLEFEDGYWYVRDLGSRNGIRVDGVKRLNELLKPGAILTIAEQRYQVAYEPPVMNADDIRAAMTSTAAPERPQEVLNEGAEPHSEIGPNGSSSGNRKRWVAPVAG